MSDPKSPLNARPRDYRKNAPIFAAWSNENLANFATDAFVKMSEDLDEIQRLKIAIALLIDTVRHLTDK